MSASCWPVWLDDIWAKSAEKGEGGRPESLAYHTWHVLARLSEFIRLRPNLPQTLRMPRLWHVLAWAAFLHDFGKATTGFQARLRGGESWPHRHEVLSLAFVDWVAGDLAPQEQAWLVAAIVSHHKDALDIQSLYPPPEDPEDDQLVARVAELDEPKIRGLWRWLAVCGKDWIGDLGLVEVGVTMPPLAGEDTATATVRRDGANRINACLKAYRNFVNRLGDVDEAVVIGALTLRGHMINADHSASAHVGALPPLSFDASAIMCSTHLAPETLYSHQTGASRTTGSALLTAPTGSGKTEAALLWAAKQAEAGGGLPRLFYTLPYQASMNAMKLRLGETFGEQNVGLQHGRGLLALYRLLLERDYAPAEAARQARWSRDLAKLNSLPIRIFSPYQMLKGMYRLKGYEALLTDYHGAAFIFDEIHAYEVKRLALILPTIRYLRQNYSARFLVMSATFPTLIKDLLRDALDNPIEIAATSDLFAAFTRHELRLVNGELVAEEALQRVAGDASAGKSVLVVCNTVARAQSTYAQLTARLAPQGVCVVLLHGRFNVRDRSAKERTVREATGSASQQRRPIVLVATQAVEVSLDIDLDTVYTDPAPLEALVQRFGRINRRRRQSAPAPVHVFRQPDDGQGIYDEALVKRTLRILEREHGRAVHESAIGGWLDEIYSGEVAELWRKEYDNGSREFEAACIQTLRPFAADAGLEKLFYRAFDSIEVLPESLYDEYMRLKDEEPIRANELLVPISWRRYHAMANRGCVMPWDQAMPPVVRVPYNEDEGLVSVET